MNIRKWFEKRGIRFVILRAVLLFKRYGITPRKAIARIEDILKTLARFGCYPTLFTPGIIVKRYLRFIQDLQAKGAEIAIHSFQHVDLSSMKLDSAKEQLDKAIETFSSNDIDAYGFRCPYLSCSTELLQSLPAGLFGYSSNKAIQLNIDNLAQNNKQSRVFNTLHRFYNPKSFADTISVPETLSNTVEIPVCVPDDIQLHDGLNLKSTGISAAWIEMLHQTHQRGELFNLIFHPELGSDCKRPFEDLLQEAISLTPTVWIARLHEIYDWWQEKAKFQVEIKPLLNGYDISFVCSSSATILARGLDDNDQAGIWDNDYHWVKSSTYKVNSNPLPFVGLAASVPGSVTEILKEQGYIIETGEMAARCGIYIDGSTLAGLDNEVKLINHIEMSTAPILRYWRWPRGAKSALCITGDLDAITLRDYVTRLFPL